MSKLKMLLEGNDQDDEKMGGGAVKKPLNNDHGLEKLMNCSDHMDLYECFTKLSLHDWHHIKNVANHNLGKKHHIYDYGEEEYNSLEKNHMKDIASNKSTHHDVSNIILDDALQGGSFFSTLKKLAKQIVNKKNLKKLGQITLKGLEEVGKYAINNPDKVIQGVSLLAKAL